MKTEEGSKVPATTNRRKSFTWKKYEDLADKLRDVLMENGMLIGEIRYLRDYIHWKGLDNEFERFQREAYEDKSVDLPFPPLVMDIQE